jgi:hypothetical protein
VTVRDDLLVVGLDLTTGREVHVADRPAEEWRQLGYGAAGTLVCFFCFHGVDAAPGTRVPLVTKGRFGGRVRTHFAHPPGQAPAGYLDNADLVINESGVPTLERRRGKGTDAEAECLAIYADIVEAYLGLADSAARQVHG